MRGFRVAVLDRPAGPFYSHTAYQIKQPEVTNLSARGSVYHNGRAVQPLTPLQALPVEWPMSERDAFLRAIRANPADDTARLVFADWLDERDDPLGQFIRIQVELEPIRYQIDRPRVQELLAREEELLNNHEQEWLGSVSGLSRYAVGFGPYFRRGLPELVCLSLDALLARGEELFAARPTLHELAVFGVQGRGAELADCPLLDRIDILEIADWVVEADAAALLASPRIRTRSVLRVWDGADYDYEHLWYAEPEGWPATTRVEVVELYGGATYGNPGRINAELDELAGLFAAAGRTLVPVRPHTTLFPLLPDQGQNLHPGRFGDGRSVLVGHGRYSHEPVVFAFFDEDGKLVEVQQHNGPECEYYEDYAVWLSREFGYQPGLIWMREFMTPQGMGIRLWPDFMVEHFENPELPDDATQEDRLRGGDIWRWLYRGSYVITWCNTPWASRRSGEITDT